MGSGIAGHLANVGVEVVLLDVAAAAPDRDSVAAGALERMRSQAPPPLMHPDHASRITTGDVADHLDRVSDCDWIVEAIVERIDVKRELYDALDRIRRPGSIVSSNTSTLPLALLTERMSPAMRSDFCITHFFNPVRFMRLLELVRGPDTRPELIAELAQFCDRELGKGVVHCRDTPGFLANRVGVHALQAGLFEAVAQGVTIEEADAVMGRPMGIPKTGLFGLYDLIGLDLMLDVAASLAMALPPDDAFQRVAEGIPAIRDLVAAGYTGNKGAGGFYRGSPDAREVVDLQSGMYRPMMQAATEAAMVGERDGLRALVEHRSAAGRFARRVLAHALGYAASLVPDVSEEIVSIDEAMKLGYGLVSRAVRDDRLARWRLVPGPARHRGLSDSTGAGCSRRFVVLSRERRPDCSLRHGPWPPAFRARSRGSARRRLQDPRLADALQPRGEPVGYRRRRRLPRIPHQGECARPGVRWR